MEAGGEVTSGMSVELLVLDKYVKFHDLLASTVLEKFYQKPSEAVLSTVFFPITSDWK